MYGKKIQFKLQGNNWNTLYTNHQLYTHTSSHLNTCFSLCCCWALQNMIGDSLLPLAYLSSYTIYLVLKIVTSWDSHHKYNNHISQGPPIINSSMYYVPWNQCVSLLLCHLAHVLCKVRVTERKEQASFQT
jgi:hypothetical protein